MMNHTETNEDWENNCQWENCSGGKYCEKHSLESIPSQDFEEKLMDEFCVMFERSQDDTAVERLISFIRSLRQSDKELILGKMEETRHEIQQDRMPLGNEQWKKGHTKCLGECKSIVEEVMR